MLCAPYHLYTHGEELRQLFAEMKRRGWRVTILLPFDQPDKLDAMARDARLMPGISKILDFTSRRWARRDKPGPVAAARRMAAFIAYALATGWQMLTTRFDLLLLTTDVGGLSIRLVQLLAARREMPIVVVQSTLFLHATGSQKSHHEGKRRDSLTEVPSRSGWWALFRFHGDVPGSFLADTYVAVQDDEIRQVCIDAGKDPSRVATFGSLQAARICAVRRRLKSSTSHRPRVLLLSECVEERFGEAMVRRDLDWLHALASAVHRRADIRVRFHPRESASYRQRLLEQLGPLATVDSAPDAVTAAASADVIVGAFSMLMFDAKAAGVPAVFIDMGVDPIGFYNERRHPRAASSRSLVSHVESALDGNQLDSLAAADDPESWARDVVDWMTGLNGVVQQRA